MTADHWEIQLLLWIHQWETPLLDMFFKSVTLLGGTSFVMSFSLILFIWLVSERQYSQSTIFASSGLLTWTTIHILKGTFMRTRPELWKLSTDVSSYSFPSGHAMLSLSLYGLSAYLVAQVYPHFRRRIYSGAGILTFFISVSRLYLGVHWPTDVLGGIALGAIILFLALILINRRQENPTENDQL